MDCLGTGFVLGVPSFNVHFSSGLSLHVIEELMLQSQPCSLAYNVSSNAYTSVLTSNKTSFQCPEWEESTIDSRTSTYLTALLRQQVKHWPAENINLRIYALPEQTYLSLGDHSPSRLSRRPCVSLTPASEGEGQDWRTGKKVIIVIPLPKDI